MATSFDPRTLSQIISLPTDAPLPVNQINGTGTDVEVTEVPHETEKVHLRVCSEFVKYTAPVTAFENSSKIASVVDSLGQPLVASIGDDRASLASLSSVLIEMSDDPIASVALVPC